MKYTSQVFFDPARRRWRRIRRVWMICAVTITALAATLVISVIVNPFLPRLNLRPIAGLPHAVDAKPQPPPLIMNRRGQNARRAEAALRRALVTTPVLHSMSPSQMSVTPAPRPVRSAETPGATQSARPLAIAFYVNWDDSSYQSLKRNLPQLDWVVPEWIRLQDTSPAIVSEIDPRALDLMRRERPELPIIPMIHNSEEGKWDSAALTQTVADEAARGRLVNGLIQFVDRNGFSGVCVDFEEVPAASQANLLHFMQELHSSFQARGWIVTQAVPFGDSDWNYTAYAAATDYLMLMTYDQHWSASQPGSIAAQDWFEQTLAGRMRDLKPDKTIICIGGYGYDWPQSGEAADVTFQEAMLAARDSEAQIKFDPATLNPYFLYEEDDGSPHAVWFLDAVTAFNQMRRAGGYGCAGFALWRLGSEDPSLWSVFGSSQMGNSVDGLRQIRYGYDVDFEGTGEILQVAAEPRDGAREIAPDPTTGLITAENYTAFPSSYVIRRSGDRQGLIALTFDDGPDPLWTARILGILKQESVPATFFIIGEMGETNPSLVRRIVDEGHDIGNHTFTHPNLGEIPGNITDLELNATQRLIEALTGRCTRLFRAPYFGDAEPTTPDEVEPAARAQRLGYLTIGLRVDPDDWEQPGADEIVRRTIEGATSTDPDQKGEVVLLHDGGGDRSQTVEALPRIIHEMRARGFRFVTISELAGIGRDQAMPPVPPREGFYAQVNRITFSLLSLASWSLHWIFLTGIVLGLSRIIFIGGLAFAQWRRARRREVTPDSDSYDPLVSIIVPAYNEEKVIGRTIESLLRSTYRHFEIVIVDDGSSDRTSPVVSEQFAAEPRVRLLTKENAGKAEALNFGLRVSEGGIIVALDADTIFQPETIGSLVARFRDPLIGAVAGNAKVGNRVNIVTRWQALEYITAQNMDRRAFASLNCITVVPGAVGAWRRELVERAGGFTSDTLAEDQDLTLRVRRLGFRVGYEESAVAWTEAPDTVNALARQRFRWSFGTLQCMWKHADALLRPRDGALGLIAMPNVWVFQILFPLISPVMDLMLVWTLIAAGLERLEHPAEYAITNLNQIIFYYALFLATDWLAAAFAFLLEKRERWGLLGWLFLQRFCYRQVMYYVMIKSVTTAARGTLVGWGKLERKATVNAEA
jgi:peptidoglycan-N-acetylglucosamine deacetylase